MLLSSTDSFDQAFDTNASTLISSASFVEREFRASTLQRFNEATFALSRECEMVMLHGRSEKKTRAHRIRSALSDLGLDVSRHSIRHRNDSAASDGWRTIRSCGSDHVRDRMVAGYRQIDLGELAHVVDHRRVFAARRQRRSDDLGTIYRFGTGGDHRSDCSHLHCAAGLGDRNGAETHCNCLARPRRRFCWGGDFILARPAFFLKRRPKSCDRNIDSAGLVFHLVGRITLLAYRKARGISISDRSPTNALRRSAAFASGHCDPRTAALSSRFHLDLIARFVCLSGDHRSCGWIHGLHLAAASL